MRNDYGVHLQNGGGGQRVPGRKQTKSVEMSNAKENAEAAKGWEMLGWMGTGRKNGR